MGTRERLMDAGLELFDRDGLAGTTITAIERRAGLVGGKGSFYRHFASKQELLQAVIDREIERVSTGPDGQPRPALPRLPDPRSQLALGYHDMLRRLAELQPLISILAREHHHLGPLTARIGETLILNWNEMERARVALLEDVPDSDALAVVISSAIVGYYLAGTFFDEAPVGIDADRFVDALVSMVAPG